MIESSTRHAPLKHQPLPRGAVGRSALGSSIGVVRRLRSESLAVDIWLSRGARIASLRDLRRGVEWMARPRGGPTLIQNNVGDDFNVSPLVGADECFPSVGPATLPSGDVPDHGEVWPRAWREIPSADPAECACACDLDCLPLRIERWATVRGATLELAYKVTNLASEPTPWLWAWHPLFEFPERATLEFDGVGPELRVESSIGLNLSQERRIATPLDAERSPITTLDLGTTSKAAAKLFAEARPRGSVTLTDADRESALNVAWNGEAIGGVGLWFNTGGWDGHRHVAIEPTSTPVESVSDVPKSRWLAPKASASWRLEVSVAGAE